MQTKRFEAIVVERNSLNRYCQMNSRWPVTAYFSVQNSSCMFYLELGEDKRCSSRTHLAVSTEQVLVKEGQFLVFLVDAKLMLMELMKSDQILSHLHVIFYHWLSLYIILILHVIVIFFIC